MRTLGKILSSSLGAAMAALLAGSIPENTSSAQAAGTTKLVAYLQKRLPSMALHDRVTVLWASGSLKNLLDTATAIESHAGRAAAWAQNHVKHRAVHTLVVPG